MANYLETARTNYFRVKDEAAFHAFIEKHCLRVRAQDGQFALFPHPDDDGFNLTNDEAGEDEDPLDIADEIAAHLTDDSIAVVMGAGAEGLRYVAGWAVAINSRGERANVNLQDIYALAEAKFGIKPTLAEY